MSAETTTETATEATEPDLRWEELLDRLEADAASTLCSLNDPDAPHQPGNLWVPPSDMGPLPGYLMPRAKTLIEAQAEIAGRIRLAQDDAARQLEALQTVHNPSTDGRPRYLSVIG